MPVKKIVYTKSVECIVHCMAAEKAEKKRQAGTVRFGIDLYAEMMKYASEIGFSGAQFAQMAVEDTMTAIKTGKTEFPRAAAMWRALQDRKKIR